MVTGCSDALAHVPGQQTLAVAAVLQSDEPGRFVPHNPPLAPDGLQPPVPVGQRTEPDTGLLAVFIECRQGHMWLRIFFTG